jgi:hypothetical protein
LAGAKQVASQAWSVYVRVTKVLPALIAASLLAISTAPAVAYVGGGIMARLVVEGPARAVGCGSTVVVVATLSSRLDGGPLAGESVRWQLDPALTGDAVSAPETTADAAGAARVLLTLGPVPGSRTVKAIWTRPYGNTYGAPALTVQCALSLPSNWPDWSRSTTGVGHWKHWAL